MSNMIVTYFLNEIRKDIRTALRKFAKELPADQYLLAIKIYFNQKLGKVEYMLVQGEKGETQWEWIKIKDMDFNQDLLGLPADGTDMFDKEGNLTPHLATALDTFTAEYGCNKTELYVLAYLVADDGDLPAFMIYVKDQYKRVINIEKEFISKA